MTEESHWLGPGDPEAFASTWLAGREPVDHAARAPSLTQQLITWLGREPHRPLRAVDLGTGRGSNLRYLAPQLPGPQHWTLLDHDPDLLQEARQRCGQLHDRSGNRIECHPCRADLRRFEHWLPRINAQTQLVTASALLDLVSADWLDQLTDHLQQCRAAVLMVLNVDGTFGCSTEHRDDELVRTAFNAHQCGNGPFGKGLGPEGATALASRLSAADYRVMTANSPWVVSPEHAELQRGLIEGWQQAATEQQPEHTDRFAAWACQRLAEVGTPGFVLQVGHTDLLALPPSHP